jgi:outer membrane receptor protein involved in Fe transport
VTYQFPLFGSTVLAGVRMEGQRYSLSQPISLTRHQSHAFPSLHIERGIGQGLTANLSYSRRVSWPNLADFSPAIRFSDATTANVGNPSVQPEITDSFEAKLKSRVLGQDIEATAYLRRTGQLRSASAELDDDGVLIIRPINLGPRITRGLNIALQGGLARGFRYSLNGNLAEQSLGAGDADGNFERRTLYSASARLEYRDGAEGRRNTDRVELRARYVGPNDFGFFRTSSFVSMSASWSHAFTDRLSSVLTVSDPFGPAKIRSSYVSDVALSRQIERASSPRVTFVLTYDFDRPTAN